MNELEIKDEKTIKAERKAKREEDRAIARLRFLLFRVWFIKNWFTILVIIAVIVAASATTGLIPENLPILGTYSYAMKDSLQRFLEIGDEEFYSIFGSITGIITLLWSIGYASSKIKAVSYYMIDKNKLLKYALAKSKLSINDKGKIISIEKRLGVDLDGDKIIGENEPAEITVFEDNIMSEILNTFSELSTILNVKRDTLKETVDEHKKETVEETPTPVVEPVAVAEVVKKKPATAFRPNKF